MALDRGLGLRLGGRLHGREGEGRRWGRRRGFRLRPAAVVEGDPLRAGGNALGRLTRPNLSSLTPETFASGGAEGIVRVAVVIDELDGLVALGDELGHLLLVLRAASAATATATVDRPALN